MHPGSIYTDHFELGPQNSPPHSKRCKNFFIALLIVLFVVAVISVLFLRSSSPRSRNEPGNSDLFYAEGIFSNNTNFEIALDRQNSRFFLKRGALETLCNVDTVHSRLFWCLPRAGNTDCKGLIDTFLPSTWKCKVCREQRCRRSGV
ncbi:hypothetical protein GEMRC1_003720 [Eukaryota sp. GEM-RC1]